MSDMEMLGYIVAIPAALAFIVMALAPFAVGFAIAWDGFNRWRDRTPK